MGNNSFWNRADAAGDIKGQPGIPKNEGKFPEWANYKNVLVNDAYTANNAFGHAAAARGLSLQDTLDSTDSFYGSTHGAKHDQAEDQAAIISGWWEEHTGNPWPKGLKQPLDYWILKSKYSATYQLIRDNFQKQLEIHDLLQKSYFI